MMQAFVSFDGAMENLAAVMLKVKGKD
jgi:hypothetical protein